MLLSTIVAATVVGAAPALAEHNCYSPPVDPRAVCMDGGSIRSVATGKYVHVRSDGVLDVTGTIHGWYEHVQFEYLPDWEVYEWWSLELSANNRLASAPASGGVVRADTTFIGWYEVFEITCEGIDDTGPYYAIKHAGSAKWLTAHTDGRLRADSTFIGWYQTFRIPALDAGYVILDLCPN